MEQENQQNQQPEQAAAETLQLENYIPAIVALAESIQDIPAQIETLVRANLARSFLQTGPDGKMIFRKDEFEKVWAYIAPEETYETTTE